MYWEWLQLSFNHLIVTGKVEASVDQYWFEWFLYLSREVEIGNHYPFCAITISALFVINGVLCAGIANCTKGEVIQAK